MNLGKTSECLVNLFLVLVSLTSTSCDDQHQLGLAILLELGPLPKCTSEAESEACQPPCLVQVTL